MATRRVSVTVVGSLNLDLVARAPRLPRSGETVGDAVFERVPGGKGANQAVAAARLGARTSMVGCVGRDDFARELVDALDRDGVRTDRVRAVDAPTGVAVIVVDATGENTIVVAPGANAHLTPELVEVTGADAVLCQLEVRLDAVATAAERAEGLFCLNAAPAQPLPPALVERADLVIANRYEAEALTGEPRLLAVTLGAEGAVLVEGGREVARASAPRVDAVDGTAAGDAFCAALVVSLLEQRPRDEALARACAAGALAASRFGAQPSLPTAAEVDGLPAG
ncbi:MAG: ribokinase [Thermoleophilia bacterium]|nr:ribokinase [Thermoleophilia bacterium]